MVLLSSALLGRAGAAQERPPQHGEAGSPPAHEESRAEFVPSIDGDGALAEELIGHLCCIQRHSSQCAQTWAQNHGITECFGLEGTFKDHQVQSPCSERAA